MEHHASDGASKKVLWGVLPLLGGILFENLNLNGEQTQCRTGQQARTQKIMTEWWAKK